MIKTIRIDKQENVKLVLFPDNQPHVQLNVKGGLRFKDALDEGIWKGDEVKVVAPLRSSLELLQLLEVSNALDHMFCKKRELVIPYLMGARFDRLMQPGDSIDLEVIAQLINGCNFERVHIFDAHSDVATLLIKNSHSHNNSKLLDYYTVVHPEEVVLICPDAGASKKLDLYTKHLNVKDIVYCQKKRDLKDGKISLTVHEPGRCMKEFCVIVDDICDGGATFIAIAEQIKPEYLTLIVSHGIFSKGFGQLEKYFQEIICSDSYRSIQETKIIKTIPLNL